MKRLLCLFLFVVVFVFSSGLIFAENVDFSLTREKGAGKVIEVDPGETESGLFTIVLQDDVEAYFDLEFSPLAGSVYANLEDKKSPLYLQNWVVFPDGEEMFVDGTLPGSQEFVVPFEVNVPENVSPGDFAGLIRVKNRKTEKEIAVSQGAGVSIGTAVGMDIIISVPGERVHEVEISDFVLKSVNIGEGDFAAITAELAYSVRGNSVVVLSADTKVTDSFGNVIFEKSDYKSKPGFPSTKLLSKWHMSYGEIPFSWGWIDLVLDLSYSPQVYGDDSSIDVVDIGQAKLRVYRVPWIQLGVVLVVFVLILLYFAVKKFKYYRLRNISKIYVVQQGDTLQTICSKFIVIPKDVIFVNHLKQPYFVNPGIKLLIPKK